MKKPLLILAFMFLSQSADAASSEEIVASNSRAVVYLEVSDTKGDVLQTGSGFLVSHDGYVVTAAHLKVDPTQRMWAVIGQREGTRFPLSPREVDDRNDTALWQFPQSPVCRYAVTLRTAPVQLMERALVLGFPGNDGLTPSQVAINNLNSGQGFYKTDGYLRPGNSGGPVLDQAGKVFAIVEAGALPGTDNNEVVPIAPAITLLKKRGVKFGLDEPMPFDTSCFASCRAKTNGIEKWTSEVPWGPVDSGWLPGGHGQETECAKLIAAALVGQPDARIDLLPGNQGKWEQSEKDIIGHVQYKYFCKGVLRTGPIYAEKQSPDCGLWN